MKWLRCFFLFLFDRVECIFRCSIELSELFLIGKYNCDLIISILYGSDRNVVVRNTCQNGAWGAEDRVLPYFPFMPNTSFDMIVLVEQNQFKVMIKHYYCFVCMYVLHHQTI
jgi:hypothetical protein